MSHRLRHALRNEDGFSLIELMVALALGSIVLTAVMTIFVNGLTGAAKVTDRVDAAQRLRVTADRVSSLLNAQICGINGDAPVTEAGATAVTFTANLGDVFTTVPTRYRIWWDSTTKRIYEDSYVSANGTTYPSSVTSRRVIGTSMVPEDGTTMFKYYGFDLANGGGLDDTVLPSPVDPNKVVAVSYFLAALPERTNDANDARKATVEGQAVAGSADPSEPDQGTKC